MSASEPDSKIDLLDSKEIITRKIKKGILFFFFFFFIQKNNK